MSQQLAFEPRPHDQNRRGGVHRGDPTTSEAAAERNLPRSGTQRHRVLMAVLDAGERGLTAEEAAQVTLMPSSASGNSAAKRLSELKDDGWVEPNGETRQTSMGCAAEVLVASEQARRTLG